MDIEETTSSTIITKVPTGVTEGLGDDNNDNDDITCIFCDSCELFTLPCWVIIAISAGLLLIIIIIVLSIIIKKKKPSNQSNTVELANKKTGSAVINPGSAVINPGSSSSAVINPGSKSNVINPSSATATAVMNPGNSSAAKYPSITDIANNSDKSVEAKPLLEKGTDTTNDIDDNSLTADVRPKNSDGQQVNSGQPGQRNTLYDLDNILQNLTDIKF